jgi:hypothetical protein
MAAAVCAAALAGDVAPAGAESHDSQASSAGTPCEGPTGERIDFISARLDERRQHARRWWIGFTSFYGIGTVVTATQAALEDDAGHRAVDIVSSVKAAFGTTRLYFFDRPAALDGGEPVRDALPACDAALARGEELLRRAADETRSRSSWKRHASVVGINALGAVIAGEGWGEREDAWISAGIGIVVGEIMTWTHPWNGVRDLEEYEERFGGAPATTWQLVPTLNGLMVTASF